MSWGPANKSSESQWPRSWFPALGIW
jgi:hypothetical protein